MSGGGVQAIPTLPEFEGVTGELWNRIENS